MEKRNVLWTLILFLATFAVSCSDNDEPKPVDADENFITEFSLTLHSYDGGDPVYTAEISDNIITMTVPYNVDLTGATANVVWTSSATILPDPSTITNWGEEQVFRVTSYNGDTNEYTYKVVRSEITQKGNVELKTMADIDAFYSAGTSAVEGDLIIGIDNGKEITSLEKLSNLKTVSGNLIINNSFKAPDLTGLENVISLGGIVIGNGSVPSEASLNLVTMGALTEVRGNIIIRNDNLQWVRLISLTRVDGNVIIASKNIESVELPVLNEIDGDFNICGFTTETKDKYENVVMGGKITELIFPKLTKIVGNLGFDYISTLQKLSMPELSNVGSVELNSLGHQIKTIDFSGLVTVEKNLKINSVRTNGAFMSDAASNTSLESMGTMSKLESVGDSIEFMFFAKLPEIPDFSSLKSVKHIHFRALDNVANALNIPNVSFTESCDIRIESWTAIPAIIGSGEQPVDISLNTISSPDVTSSCPSIKGFTSIKNLNIFIQTTNKFNYNSTIEYDVERIKGNLKLESNIEQGKSQNLFSFPNLKSIEGSLIFNSNAAFGIGTLSMPNLVDIGGQFYWGPTALTGFDFSSLETIGCGTDNPLIIESDAGNTGMLYIDGYWIENDFELPKLKHVGGSKGIYLSLEWSYIPSISFPQLKTIDSSFVVSGEGCDLSSLSMNELETVKSVKISNLSYCYNFSSFATPIKNGSITKDNWSISGCGYNPTYEDMKAGKYSQDNKKVKFLKRSHARKRPNR